jgi:hypothetical protein
VAPRTRLTEVHVSDVTCLNWMWNMWVDWAQVPVCMKCLRHHSGKSINDLKHPGGVLCGVVHLFLFSFSSKKCQIRFSTFILWFHMHQSTYWLLIDFSDS